MATLLASIGNLLVGMFETILKTLGHNWWVLAISITTAVALKTYVDTAKLSKLLTNKARVSLFLSVAVGAFTPFCACGTMAVIVGMLTTALPWGPIMAFLTSSPLMSPDGFLMISGLISLRFAVALTISSLAIGLFSGFATQWIEKRTGYLRGQARYLGSGRNAACACAGGSPSRASTEAACSCQSEQRSSAPSVTVRNTPVLVSAMDASARTEEGQPNAQDICDGVGCAALPVASPSGFSRLLKKAKLEELLHGFINLGLRQILLYFSIFIGIGYLVNAFVPSSIVSALLGANNIWAVPLASLIGLPLYLTTESSIPLIQSMLLSGASEGAMLAFIITGSATSAWVIAGLTTFMKKRALALYVAFILLGGLASGYLYDLFLSLV